MSQEIYYACDVTDAALQAYPDNGETTYRVFGRIDANQLTLYPELSIEDIIEAEIVVDIAIYWERRLGQQSAEQLPPPSPSLTTIRRLAR